LIGLGAHPDGRSNSLTSQPHTPDARAVTKSSTALSTLPPVVIIGAGGHAKVAIELLRAVGTHQIAGIIARDAAASPVLGLSILGTDSDLPRFRHAGIRHAFVGIGDNLQRLKVAQYVRQVGFELVNAVSPAAVVSDSAKLGCGIAIMPGVVINAEARIDDLSVINTCASIDHDCWIAEGVHVAVGCRIAGNVKVGRLAFVGAGTTVIPRISIGESASIGAGSCVIRDVPDNARAWGVPAQVKSIAPSTGSS
jgi:UDP-perosamine 4-acetyltransferase